MKYLSKLILNKLIMDQAGVAAIPVTIVLIIVMTTIATGITASVISNNNNTLESEMSTQANYAAESGVNDAIQAYKEKAPIPPNQNCTTYTNEIEHSPYNFSSTLNNNPKVGYTCVTITGQPGNLQLPVSQSQSSVIRINPASPVGSLSFTWSKSNPTGGNMSDCNQQTKEFASAANWDCPYSAIRMDLYRSSANDNTNVSDAQAVEDLNNDTTSFIFFPTQNFPALNTINFNNHEQLTVIPAYCTSGANGDCTVTLTMPSGQTFADGYARLTSLYSDAGVVTISNSGGALFGNSQLEVDSTGMDQNVLRRIQVRVDLTGPNTAPTAPSDALNATTSLCKGYYLINNPTNTDKYPVPGIHTTKTSNPGGRGPLCGDAFKPVIYLYPTKTEHVNVQLSYPTGFSKTIPTYQTGKGWNVIAHPSGEITNIIDGRTYPYLYWEGNKDNFNFNMKQGFVVPGSQTISFLKHELPIIGLDKVEMTAFIQYWAPKMENNKYSLIHFAGKEYTNMAPLNITPSPDSLLRVFMAEEPINQPTVVTPQTFSSFHRSGFTVVEWGGTILSK